MGDHVGLGCETEVGGAEAGGGGPCASLSGVRYWFEAVIVRLIQDLVAPCMDKRLYITYHVECVKANLECYAC